MLTSKIVDKYDLYQDTKQTWVWLSHTKAYEQEK